MIDDQPDSASPPPDPTPAPPPTPPRAEENDRIRSLIALRRRLIFAAIGLVVVNLIVTTTDAAGGAILGVLWAAVAACFLGALAVGLMESSARRALTKPASTGTESADAAKDSDDKRDSDAPPLLHKGNPMRWLRGGLTTGVGAIGAFLLMAHNGQLRVGIPLGAVFCAIAAWGVMDLLGTFDDPDDRVAGKTTLANLATPLLATIVAFVVFLGTIGLAASGVALPSIVCGAIVTIAFLVLVAAIFNFGVKLGPLARDELGEERPLYRRHGFWVVAAAAALYFPFMGSFSLWDPWETHYGEVAREILARDDWISLWWAQDGWFWSKPILDFWIQALAMATLGVHYQPDQMLVGTGMTPSLHPEWVVRAPVVLLVIVAMYVLYKGVAKAFGRRAGLLGALVLATMPDWYFLAHQTMTDMPFVASMTAAMGLLLLGVRSDEEAKCKLYEVKVGGTAWRLSAWHMVFGAILVCTIPQVLYLFSRNLELVLHGGGAHGLRPHWDEFKSGSAINCGLPGNEACAVASAASIPKSVGPHPTEIGGQLLRTFGAFEPFLQAILWSAVLGAVLYMNWGERRVRRLFYLAAWFFAALATMGKGPAGFAIPMICAFAYVCTKRRWVELTRLEIVSGLLIILCVALPWYVAMYVRHGAPFTDRLIFHDMFNRAFNHVHDTNEGDDTSFRFYIWQLGYAIFPWTGLAPLGLIYWMRRGDSADQRKGDTSIFLAMWFVFAFALFSFMGTKFHHYIFPAVPPIAMLIGVVLDDMLGSRSLSSKGALPAYLGGIAAGVALTVFGVAKMWPGSIFGTKAEGGTLSNPSYALGGALLAVGVVMILVFVQMFRQKEAAPAEETLPILPDTADGRRRAHESMMIAGAVASGAVVLALVGRDLIIKPDGADQPGAIRLLQLFTYNYRRTWPDSLDFKAALTAFVIIAIVLSLAMSWQAVRRHAVVTFVAFGFVWAVWGLDVYMVKTAPHWGQHEVIEAYYAARQSNGEKLVAYQMNWKGENFYTGNHIPAFVSSGANFTTWLKKEKESGAQVMFFVTEHSRVGGLKSEVAGKNYRELTTKEICNKFVLVRAEL